VTRTQPVQPPYEPELAQRLDAMMPPGVPPILLFRTFVRNLPMARAMGEWGSYELSRKFSLSMRDREIVIDRTCARCGCEYEWGVHVAFYADRVQFTDAQVRSLTHGGPTDPCWASQRDRLLIRIADALCTDADIDDHLWDELSAEFNEAQLLDLTMLCGWYHAISFTAKACRISLEPGAPTFDSVRERSVIS